MSQPAPRLALNAALKQAMLARDAARLSTIRMMIAEILKADVEARGAGAKEAADADLLSAFAKLAKRGEDSIAQYEAGGRQDLADKERAEIAVIREFLPQPLTPEQTAEAVRAAVAETGASGPRDMGKVMAALKAAHGSRLDMGAVGPLVKAALAG